MVPSIEPREAASTLKEYPGFGKLVRGALESGCRYGELCRLRVKDFDSFSGSIKVRLSKAGTFRFVNLTDNGKDFFKAITGGKDRNDLIFINEGRLSRELKKERKRLEENGEDPDTATIDDAGEWRPAEQGRPMAEANAKAKFDPPINFHALRHTWASHAVMNGVPPEVVADNLGHKDTTMVQKHYAHLNPQWKRKFIRDKAPKFGTKIKKKVAPLKAA